MSFFTEEEIEPAEQKTEQKEKKREKEPEWSVHDQKCLRILEQFATSSVINAHNAENDNSTSMFDEVMMHNTVIDSLFPPDYYLQLSEELSVGKTGEQHTTTMNCLSDEGCGAEFVAALKTRIPLLQTIVQCQKKKEGEQKEMSKKLAEEQLKRLNRFTMHSKTNTIYHCVDAKESVHMRNVDIRKALRFVKQQTSTISLFTTIEGLYVRNTLLLQVPSDASSVVEFLGLREQKSESSNQQLSTGSTSTLRAVEAGESSVYLVDSFSLVKEMQEKKEEKVVCCAVDIAPLESEHIKSNELKEASRSRVYYNLAVEEERKCTMKTCRAIQSQVMLMAEPRHKLADSEFHTYVEPLLGFSELYITSLKHSKKTQVVKIQLKQPAKKPITRILKRRSDEAFATKEANNFEKLKSTGLVPKVYYHGRGFELLSYCGTPMYKTNSEQFMMKILDIVEQVHRMGYVLFDIKPENFCYLASQDSLYMIDLEFLAHTSESLPARVCPGTKGYICFKLVENCLNQNGHYPHQGYDVFSLGVMLMEIVAGKYTDDGVGLYLKKLREGKKSQRPVDVEEDHWFPVLQAVESCFDPVLNNRPSVLQLRQQILPLFLKP